MPGFFSRLVRLPRAPGQRQAPPAQGQAQVHALLNPDAVSYDDLDNLVQAIHEADPQARRGLSILGRRGRSTAAASSVSPPELGDNARITLTPEIGSTMGNRESGSTVRTEPSSNLSPPASLLTEDAQPEASSSPEESSFSSHDSPGPHSPHRRERGWAPLRDIRTGAAEHDGYDSDAALLGSGFSASSFDVPHALLGDTGASLPPHSHRIQGRYEAPGGPSGSQTPPDSPGEGPSRPPVWPRHSNEGGQVNQAPLRLNTSVLSFGTNDTEDFTVRIRGESTHTSPASSYHFESSDDLSDDSSDESLDGKFLKDLRDE